MKDLSSFNISLQCKDIAVVSRFPSSGVSLEDLFQASGSLLNLKKEQARMRYTQFRMSSLFVVEFLNFVPFLLFIILSSCKFIGLEQSSPEISFTHFGSSHKARLFFLYDGFLEPHMSRVNAAFG